MVDLNFAPPRPPTLFPYPTLFRSAVPADSTARPREPPLGCRADRRRTRTARLRAQRTHRAPLSPACAPSTTDAELAHLPPQPRVRDLGGRPVHSADPHAPHGIRAD